MSDDEFKILEPLEAVEAYYSDVAVYCRDIDEAEWNEIHKPLFNFVYFDYGIRKERADMGDKEILKLLVDDGSLRGTIGDYLSSLLKTVWREKEDFNGKRPFGNSGWQYDIYKSLIEAGLISGSLDSDGYIRECQNEKGDEIISGLIDYIFRQD